MSVIASVLGALQFDLIIKVPRSLNSVYIFKDPPPMKRIDFQTLSTLLGSLPFAEARLSYVIFIHPLGYII